MFRRTTGRRWRRRDIRGIPYEAVEPEAGESAARAPLGTPVCPECGRPRPDDERVAGGMPCELCES